MSLAKGSIFWKEKSHLSREVLGVSDQGKLREYSTPVRGISYAEAVKEFKGHDGCVLVEAQSSVTFSSQILHYKSSVEYVNHLSRAYRKKEAKGYALSIRSLCNFSDEEMALEVATRRWETVEQGFGLDEDKATSVQKDSIFDNSLGAEQRSSAGPVVLPKRHNISFNSVLGAE
ncbi:hypothetical protein VNO78_15756 [Psophocarpus tetragonolobus]|uniref:Uncharacterized protein n=1 Tax=Psophocarpus tetragonolobus TaxID=3891 RepID=A0AAN9SEJ3_PSOTE